MKCQLSFGVGDWFSVDLRAFAWMRHPNIPLIAEMLMTRASGSDSGAIEGSDFASYRAPPSAPSGIALLREEPHRDYALAWAHSIKSLDVARNRWKAILEGTKGPVVNFRLASELSGH
jgi:hypothetical protein